MDPVNPLTAIQDALRRRAPAELDRLTKDYPELGLARVPARTLGRGDELREEAAQSPIRRAPDAAAELARVSLREAKKDLSEVLHRVEERTRRLALLRLASGAVSILTSGGLFALLLGAASGPHSSTTLASIGTAGVSFAASGLGLLGSYLEDFSGGEGSTKKLRELALLQVRNLAQAESHLRLALLTGGTNDLIEVLAAINAVLAEIQFARAHLGLAI